jgi:hydroxyacylglutathione hydrolase
LIPATSSSFYLRQLQLGPMKNFVYMVGARDAREVAVVDPAWEVDKLVEAATADGKTITHALITHSHYDHVNGLEDLLAKSAVRVVVNREELAFNAHLRSFQSNLQPVRAGDEVEVGSCHIRCVHTPGHTPGSQCFHVEGSLISGDTLFIGACGRCDLDGGDPEAMYRTLTGTLMAMEGGTVLYPGHDYGDRPVSTMSHEGKTNPYLQFHDLEAFVNYRMRKHRKPRE